jgi:hypothetical protein
MTNTELVIWNYVALHNNCHRSSMVDSLSYGDWTAGRKLRQATDSLVARGIIQKIGTGTRNVCYTIPKESA